MYKIELMVLYTEPVCPFISMCGIFIYQLLKSKT